MVALRRQYNALIWALVSIGCGLQLYYISDQYFHYYTVTQVSINRSYYIKIPKIILCFPNIIAKAGDFAPINTEGRGVVSSNHPRPRDIVREIRIREQADSGVEEFDKRKYDVKMLTKRKKLCYVIELTHLREFNPEPLKDGDPTMFAIIFDYEKVAELVEKGKSTTQEQITEVRQPILYMHPSDKQFYGERFTGIIVDMSVRGVDVTYSYYKTKLEKKPYKTNCTNYNETFGYESKEHCAYQCKRELYDVFAQRVQRDLSKVVPLDLINAIPELYNVYMRQLNLSEVPFDLFMGDYITQRHIASIHGLFNRALGKYLSQVGCAHLRCDFLSDAISVLR